MQNHQLLKFVLVLLAVLGCLLPSAGIAQNKIQTESFAIQENSSFLDMIDDQNGWKIIHRHGEIIKSSK